jgi:hypothetical protein
MSISLLVTRGFGNGTFAGSISKIVTAGFTASSFVSFHAETINLRVSRREITLDQYPRSVSLRQTPRVIKLEV